MELTVAINVQIMANGSYDLSQKRTCTQNFENGQGQRSAALLSGDQASLNQTELA